MLFLPQILNTQSLRDCFVKWMLWWASEWGILTKCSALSPQSAAATIANDYKLPVLWIIQKLICSIQCKDNVERKRSLFFPLPATDLCIPALVWSHDTPSVWHASPDSFLAAVSLFSLDSRNNRSTKDWQVSAVTHRVSALTFAVAVSDTWCAVGLMLNYQIDRCQHMYCDRAIWYWCTEAVALDKHFLNKSMSSIITCFPKTNTWKHTAPSLFWKGFKSSSTSSLILWLTRTWKAVNLYTYNTQFYLKIISVRARQTHAT